MASRLELHEELCEILNSRNVYFKPPESLKMHYPCIKYSLSGVSDNRADNRIYKSMNEYELTIIDYDPDSTIYKDVMNHFQMCSFVTSYVSDNLNHTKLKLYH